MSVLTSGQAQIVSVASRGHNLLITVQAGTGKFLCARHVIPLCVMLSKMKTLADMDYTIASLGPKKPKTSKNVGYSQQWKFW